MKKVRTRELAFSSVEWTLLLAIALVIGAGTSAIFKLDTPKLSEGISASISDGIWQKKNAANKKWAGVRIESLGSSSASHKLSAKELQLHPFTPTLSAWKKEASSSTQKAGVAINATANICSLCANINWRKNFKEGIALKGAAKKRSKRSLIDAGIEAQGRGALLSTELLLNLKKSARYAAGEAQGRARGTIGVETDASLNATVSEKGIGAEVKAGAMAGAVAKAEVRAGVNLLGLALTSSGRVEGWAGAGAKGELGVKLATNGISWNIGGAAAWGLGAGGQWKGAIDTSSVPKRYKQVAQATIATSLFFMPPLSGISLLAPKLLIPTHATKEN